MSTFSLELKFNISSKLTKQVYLEGANESIKRQVRRLIAVNETLLIHTIVNETRKRNGHIVSLEKPMINLNKRNRYTISNKELLQPNLV